jgi:hypothetical protein
MSNYKLSDNVQDEFNFEVRDKKYKVRYPRVEELEEITTLNNKLKEAQDDKRDDDVKNISAQLEEFFYQFVSPDGHDTPIKEALSKENIRVMRNFNKMIQAEFAIS